MNQNEVLEFLNNNPNNWFTNKEIANSLGAKKRSKATTQLYNYGFLEMDSSDYKQGFRFKIKKKK